MNIFRVSLLFIFVTSLLAACATDEAYTVSICDQPDDPTSCVADQPKFRVGQSLSVRLEADQPFSQQQIIGKILRLTGSDTMSLGARMITPEPGQRIITQDLPFHEFGSQAAGTFLIEFVDEHNQPITSQQLTIVEAK